jgi:hypothetical protein
VGIFLEMGRVSAPPVLCARVYGVCTRTWKQSEPTNRSNKEWYLFDTDFRELIGESRVAQAGWSMQDRPTCARKNHFGHLKDEIYFEDVGFCSREISSRI